MQLSDKMREEFSGEKGQAKRKMDLDTFGEIMDEFIRETACGVGVQKEEGEEEWTILSAGCGAVIDFYIYLNGLKPIYLAMLDEMRDKDGELMIKTEKLSDTLTDLLRDELAEAERKAELKLAREKEAPQAREEDEGHVQGAD